RRADEALDRLSTDALAAAGGALAPAVGRGTALDLRALAAHPQEIVLRALASALGPDAPIRLDRLEACADALVAASRAGRPLRRTLAGRLLALDGAGMLAIRPEPARSRGRRTAPVTLPAAGPPHSLGNEGPGT
ncbi:MAG: tilS, partial [Enterovirga sp.]|nr:tilS [Enterovirga sp.]